MVSADQVIPDDLIVQGSIGVGFDALNGLSFGFDTIILKENNLRVLFDDTSSTAGFPANDWRLTANDSASGGASFFSIDDATAGRQILRVDAGAPTNSLRVDNGGRVGFGTATPSVSLHVANGNTPTLRFEQNGSSGFTPQTWDIAGNEANFFIRDVTGGSKLPFRIRPGAPTSSIDINASGDVGLGTTSAQGRFHVENTGANDTDDFVVLSTGNVGIGTVTPASRLSVRSPATNVDVATFTSSDGQNLVDFTERSDTSGMIEVFNAAGSNTIRLRGLGPSFFDGGFMGILNQAPAFPLHVGTNATNGNGAHVTIDGVWTDGSSRAIKERIEPLDADEAMAAFRDLNPVTYYGKDSVSGEQYVGFIAEDVPALVAMNGRKGIAAIEISALVTKVVQQQQAVIERQQQTIGELKLRMEQLERRVESPK